MKKEEIDQIISSNTGRRRPLPEDFSMFSYPEWDSLAYMAILAELESISKKKITPMEALKLQSLEGIYKLFLDSNE